MKILVTGASGFIGGNIVEMLAKDTQNEITATGRSFIDKFNKYYYIIILLIIIYNFSNKYPITGSIRQRFECF